MARSRGTKGRPTRIFYAADIHGSELTYRKFLNAASFYDVDALVFGGDLMGKALVPIVKEGGTYRAHVQGVDHVVEDDHELERLCRSIELPGFYWSVVDRDRYLELKADPLAVKGLFHERAIERLRRWIVAAQDKLAGTHVRLFLTGGNDDEPSVLKVLDDLDSPRVIACEGRVVDLDERHTMITVGLSTPTPWDTPREAPEAQIAAVIDAEVAKVADLSRCVFNLHCPPKDTPLDTCLLLQPPSAPGELPKPVRRGGRFVTTGGGSIAVREAISRFQPVIGLHGHIHESLGRFRLGRTPCFNPGSEYTQGQLQGWIVTLKDGKVRAYQHTSG
jgi:Icc-related predicted phosphoesterase